MYAFVCVRACVCVHACACGYMAICYLANPSVTLGSVFLPYMFMLEM